MTEPFSEYDLYSAINALLATRREIAVYWDVSDVQCIRPDLTEEQAWTVLQDALRDHDAGLGINWHVLECHAAERYGEEPEDVNTDDKTNLNTNSGDNA